MLFGRDWFWEIKLDWGEIHSLKSYDGTSKDISLKDANMQVQRLMAKYKLVSTESLGTLKGVKAKLNVEEGVQPKFYRRRNVPCAIKPYFEELERLQKEGIIYLVQNSQLASGVVPVAKRETKDVRLCEDYRVTINPVLRKDKYPLPLIEDIFAKMAGGKRFSKIYLKNAYLQMEDEEDSKQYLTINTHKGRSGLRQHPRYGRGQWSRPYKESLAWK